MRGFLIPVFIGSMLAAVFVTTPMFFVAMLGPDFGLWEVVAVGFSSSWLGGMLVGSLGWLGLKREIEKVWRDIWTVPAKPKKAALRSASAGRGTGAARGWCN